MILYKHEPRANYFRVLLYGKDVANWIEANDDRGYVVVRERPAKPWLQAKERTIHGSVKIERIWS